MTQFVKIFLLVVLGISTIVPQQENVLDSGGRVLSNEIGLVGAPYVVGEKFVFEGKFKKLVLSFVIAEMDFTVTKKAESEDFVVKSHAKSKGILAALFSFRFLQQYESTVDGGKLRIIKTIKHDEQKKRIRDSEADFDYEEKSVVWIETDPNEPTKQPRRVSSKIRDNTQDIISAAYMLRQMPLEMGKTFSIQVSDSGLVYDIPVKVTAREEITSIVGKKWCWRIEAEIFGEGRFIDDKGSFTVWVADDKLRTPIKAKLGTKLGTVTFKLKAIEMQKAN